MPTDTLTVPDIGCDGCEGIVEGAVTEVDGVESAAADQAEGEVTVEGEEYDLEAVSNKVERAGYDVADPPISR